MEIWLVILLLFLVWILKFVLNTKVVEKQPIQYYSKIVLNNKGFYDIKVGDTFEGCACGHFGVIKLVLKLKGI